MPEVMQTREHLLAALEPDLIDPYDGAEAFATSTERLRIPPSRWYRTSSSRWRRGGGEDPPDDEAGAGSDTDAEDGSAPDDPPKRRHMLPASIGRPGPGRQGGGSAGQAFQAPTPG